MKECSDRSGDTSIVERKLQKLKVQSKHSIEPIETITLKYTINPQSLRVGFFDAD